jgi:uncharacterized protein (TIGR00159 family)
VNLFNIDFITFRLLDLIDILLVAILIYVVFKILRGSIAFNIFIGMISIYILWFAVKAMNMRLLSTILGQFIGVGVIALLIVFQQEIRRFLLLIGQNRMVLNSISGWKQILPWNWNQTTPEELNFKELAEACKWMSKTLTGGTIVLARASELRFFTTTGIVLDADMSSKLLQSIFTKKSPLHDGAVIVSRQRIKAASCILPVSERTDLPSYFGLRHRSAMGIAEQTDAMVIVISEETGRISVASGMNISSDLSREEDLEQRLKEEYFGFRE